MSLQEIKVSREEVLEIVKENKKKHDAIFKDAVEGFWLEAEKTLKKTEKEHLSRWEKDHKDKLKQMRKVLRQSKKELKEQIKKELVLVGERKKDGPWQYMRNPYPENHSDDYIGTIRRLELCVEGEVKLDGNEFDQYVRNKWEWRNRFLSSNTGYVSSYYNSAVWGTGSCYAISSSWSCQSVSASYSLTASYSSTGLPHSVVQNGSNETTVLETYF